MAKYKFIKDVEVQGMNIPPVLPKGMVGGHFPTDKKTFKTGDVVDATLNKRDMTKLPILDSGVKLQEYYITWSDKSINTQYSVDVNGNVEEVETATEPKAGSGVMGVDKDTLAFIGLIGIGLALWYVLSRPSK